MRVVHLSTRERHGGAARAAHRLHRGLLALGVASRVRVMRKDSDDPTVHGPSGLAGRALAYARRRLDGLPLRLHPGREDAPFHLAWMPGVGAARIGRLRPDVVNLHWLGGGFVRLGALARLGVPVVWTLHDMWAFTGGCHYSGGCVRHREACGACPRLGSGRERDLSRWTWRRKRAVYGRMDLTVVTPSRWMAGRAAGSSLLGGRRIEVIPNGLDTDRYRPVDRAAARRALGLPGDRLLVAFGAVGADSDRRKGYAELRRALARLGASPAGEGVDLVTFGGDPGRAEEDPGLPVHRLGRLDGVRDLVRAYAAADVFVAPSLEDNLPNTVLEALACGTPVAAFAAGGIPDMVEPGVNGELAPVGDVEALARALAAILGDGDRRARMAAAARERAVRDHGAGRQARRYLRLYEELAGP